jgi:hypothetical protein
MELFYACLAVLAFAVGCAIAVNWQIYKEKKQLRSRPKYRMRMGLALDVQHASKLTDGIIEANESLTEHHRNTEQDRTRHA